MDKNTKDQLYDKITWVHPDLMELLSFVEKVIDYDSNDEPHHIRQLAGEIEERMSTLWDIVFNELLGDDYEREE